MNCPKCQKEIPEGSKFCLECGSNLSAISGVSGMEEDISTFQMPIFEARPGQRKQTGDESLDKMCTIPGPRKSAKKLEISQEAPLSDRYQIIEEIGRGGFAVVYKARDKNLDRIVAVKRLLAEHLTNSRAKQTLERFDREAHAIATLNHRNIVRVHDYGHDSDGPYIVMECIEGSGTLHDFLKKQGRLSVSETMKLIRGVCQGLSFAHKRNLIHRDIKPANILLEREGDGFIPKIVDFGLARIGYDSTTSMTGYGMGTPYYMPPEQRRDAKNVNHTADIYALGKTIYEMVTGEIPDNVDPEVIPPPPQLAKIIIKCIKSRPEDRYFSIDELLKNLEELNIGASPTVISKAAAASGNVCPNCYVGNPEDVKFCESCGTGLTQSCPECERENSVYKQFCGGCGTDIKGFLQAQESLQRMEKLKSEKNGAVSPKNLAFCLKIFTFQVLKVRTS